MSWISLGGAAIGAIGGLMGGGSASQSSSVQLDPRMASYLYGDSGQGGLLGDTRNLYAQQSAQGGLNPMQNAGLEMQRMAYTDPRYTQGFDMMRNAGSGLLGAGVAGNPFTGGGMSAPQQPMPQQPMPGRMTIQPVQGMSHAMGIPTRVDGVPQGLLAGPGASTGAPQMGTSADVLRAAYTPIQQQTAPAPVAGRTQADLDALIRQAQAPKTTAPWVDNGEHGGL